MGSNPIFRTKQPVLEHKTAAKSESDIRFDCGETLNGGLQVKVLSGCFKWGIDVIGSRIGLRSQVYGFESRIPYKMESYPSG